MHLWRRAGTRGGREGRGVASLRKPPQLQHPHSRVVLAKLECPLAPHGTSQTHVHTPWVTSPRLVGWGHLAGSLGVGAGGITPFHSCTVAAEPADPISCGQINVTIPQQGMSQLWAMGEAGKRTWPGTMDERFIAFSWCDFPTTVKAEQKMDTVKTSSSRISHNHHLSLELTVPTTSALQKLPSPASQTLSPSALSTSRSGPLAWGRPALPRVVPAGVQAWQAAPSGCFPVEMDTGIWKSNCSSRVGKLAQKSQFSPRQKLKVSMLPCTGSWM